MESPVQMCQKQAMSTLGRGNSTLSPTSIRFNFPRLSRNKNIIYQHKEKKRKIIILLSVPKSKEKMKKKNEENTQIIVFHLWAHKHTHTRKKVVLFCIFGSVVGRWMRIANSIRSDVIPFVHIKCEFTIYKHWQKKIKNKIKKENKIKV